MDITIFKGARNTKPDNLTGLTWADVCDLAEAYMCQSARRSAKLDHDALIFGRCEHRRANANVRFLSGLCADFDLGPADSRYLSFHDQCDRLEAGGFKFIAYTTTKNSALHNKYRLIMPYGRDVEPWRCGSAWLTCNDKLGGAIDQSTKDPARLSFAPAAWTENPFWEPSTRKGEGAALITLADPFNAMRVNRKGAPILSVAEIDVLSATGVVGEVRTNGARPYVPALDRLTETERAELARGHHPDAPVWGWIVNLHGPLVLPWMLRDLPLEEGNRDYRFMQAVARHAIANRIPISVEALVVLAEQFSTECLRRPPAADVHRQAENALAWAFRNSGPEPEPCQPVNVGDQP